MPGSLLISKVRRGSVRRVVAGLLFAAAAMVALCGHAHAEESLAPSSFEWFGEVELESTLFFQSPQFVGQDRDDVSVAGQVTFLAEWMAGDLAFRFTPFGRLDAADDRRTHWDIREAKVDYVAGDWSFTVGADTVFWGKTEVVHLVDIINQTDLVENLDDESRLGQPMFRVGYLSEIGEFSAFYMPYFRERTFPGVSGRLRVNPAVNSALPVYDTGAEEWTPSFALRYTGVFGNVDLGLSGFYGLGRDPAFFFDSAGNLRPFYEKIAQFGVDVQYTTDATLWKAEGIFRQGQRNRDFVEENYVALTGGLEHTLFGIADSSADLGLIAEYAWDSRGDKALTNFQNDLILGTRLALNDEADTALLLTGSVDVEDAAIGLRLEGDRRLADQWTLGVEALGFINVGTGGLRGGGLDRDSYVRLKLTYFFGGE